MIILGEANLQKRKKIWHWKMNSLGRQVPNIRLEKSGEIAPEGMKTLSQSKNTTQLWVCLVVEVKCLWASLVGMRFDSKHDCSPPAILLGLLLCPWIWDFFFFFFFFGGIQHSPVDGCAATSWFWCSCRRRWAHVPLLHHLDLTSDMQMTSPLWQKVKGN